MNVGELTATFDVDARGAERGIAQAEAAMVGLEANADAVGEHIRDSMDEVMASLHPEFMVDADTTPADAEVATLIQHMRDLRDVQIGVDVPIAQVLSELDEIRVSCEDLQNHHPDVDIQIRAMDALFALDLVDQGIERIAYEHPTVQIDVENARALAELEEVIAEAHHVGAEDPHVDVHTDTSEAKTAQRDVSALTGALGSAAGSASSFGSTFAMGAASVGSAIPVVAGLVAMLQNILPAAGIAATGLFMVASAGAAIKIGTSGIGGALHAAFADVPASAGAAASGTNQLADAQRNLKDATQNAADANVKAARAVGDAQRTLADDQKAVTDAQVQGARQVASAERSLADAEKASQQAQLDLNAARRQASMDLEDLTNQVTDASLSQRGDVLAVQQAQQELDKTKANPASTEAQIAQAQLAYDTAVQRLQEQGLALDRLKDKQAQAAQAGVDGSALVVAAQAKVVSADRAVGDQQQALTDAQIQAQDKVAAALRKVGDQVRAVADAQDQQAKTAYQGAEQIQKAMEALGQAGAKAAGGGVDPLAAALAKLSPSARAFVEEIIRLKPQLEALKLDVQQRLMQGLDGTLAQLAATSLPVFRQALVDSAGHLNDMAKGVGSAAIGLSESGVLGQALSSANKGLGNLIGLPGQFVTGLGQIGAAAGGAFDRVTSGAGNLATKVSESLGKAFSGGGLEKAINAALDILGQLGTAAGNIGSVLGEVFGAAQQSGAGFASTLVKITGSLKEAFGTPAVQAGLATLFTTMSVLASTVAPLLGQALQVIGPVLSALGPPVQALVQALGSALGPVLAALGPVMATVGTQVVNLAAAALPILSKVLVALAPPLQALITAIGGALGPIIVALGPVLLAAAQAVGSLIVAAAPLLGLVGQLAADLLPALTPLLAGASTLFTQLAPLVAAVATALSAALGPILAQLPNLIGPFVTILTSLTGAVLPILAQLITQLPLASLGQSFAQVAIALAPLLAQLAVMIGQYLQILMPILVPIIGAVAQLAALFAGVLAQAIQGVLVPALKFVTDLLRGDLRGAIGDVGNLLSGLGRLFISVFADLPGKIQGLMIDLGRQLFDSGAKIIGGLIDGIKSKIGNVKDAVSSVLSGARNLLPFSPAREGPFSGSGWTLYSGQSISHALAEGILGGQGRVRAATQSLMATAHGGIGGGLGGQFALAGGAGVGMGGGFHIENYHESANGSARSTAEELWWLGKQRG